MSNPKLERFIDELIEDDFFQTRGELARKIAMTDSGFSRAIRDEGTLSTDSCLRLARVLKEHPADILRVAGKGEQAEILNALCRGKEFQLTRREQERVRLWRLIPVQERIAFDALLNISARRAASGGAGVGRKRKAKGTAA